MSYLFTVDEQQQVTTSIKKSVATASTGEINLGITHSRIDNVDLFDGDRVLLKNQTAPAENGIYTLNADGFLIRSEDANSNLKLAPGLVVNVKGGLTHADTLWSLANDADYVLGTDPITFEQVGFSQNFLYVETAQTVNGFTGSQSFAQFAFNPLQWGSTTDNREYYFGAILAVNDGARTGEVILYNLSNGEAVTLTGGTLTTSSTTPVKLESGALNVGNGVGDLKNFERIYEIRITNDGTDPAEETYLGSAWIRIV